MNLKEKVHMIFSALSKVNNFSNVAKNLRIEYRKGGIDAIKRKISEVARRQEVKTNNGTNFDFNMQIFHEQQNALTIEEMKKKIKSFKLQPLISIVMPVYNVPLKWLECAIRSLHNQTYQNWELCAVDDCSKDGRVRAALTRYAAEDSRIKVSFSERNGGISVASNKSIAMATGEFIALMDNDDELTPDAFFWIVNEINLHPNTDFIYSDECIADDSNNGRKIEFIYKPNWSPESLMGFMYTGHLTVYRTHVVKQLGGFRSQHDIGQDFDMALRVSEVAKNIRHVERVLYIWRAIEGSIAKGGKQSSVVIGANVGRDAMMRRGFDAHVMMRPYGCYYRLKIPQKGKVSIIIPTDSFESISEAVQTISQVTAYTNYEIIAVCNSLVSDRLEKEFSYLNGLKICRFDELYNYALKCNRGAEIATGDIFVFLQDCNRIENGTWLDALIELLYIDGVGAVSPQIIRPDDTIRYAGMVSGLYGLTGIPFNGVHKDGYDEFWTRHRWIRDITVLSASCIAIKRENYNRVGGFDSVNTPLRYSNADLSYKLIDNGLRCVYNPHVVLRNVSNQWWDSWFHSPQISTGEHAFLLKRWGHYLTSDPYFSKTMQRAIVRDLPCQYQIFHNNDPNKEYHGKNVLLVSHELTLTGAPVVLHYAARAIKESGGFPVVISPVDGIMRQELVEDGITVVIDPQLFIRHWYFEEFANSFDLMIVNTLVASPVIEQFKDKKLPVLWWIHEGEISFYHLDKIVPRRVGENIKIYCGGEYSKSVLFKHRSSMSAEVLLYGVPDHREVIHPQNETEAIVFSVIGTIDSRKGQDIFIRAIESMPTNYQSKAEFWIVGKTHDHEIERKISIAIEKIPQIKRIEEMSRIDLARLYSQSDVLVSSSRDDPMPVVMTEGMIFSKVCICSTNTGTASLIVNGKNGFVFQNEDFSELSKRMMYLIDHPVEMNAIGIESRKIYEENFKMTMFNEKLTGLINDISQ